MIFDDLKYAQRERLIYLDQCFAWRGTANRSDLIERFGVSTAQAALDFKAYLDRAEETPPTYDPGRKTYLAAENHVSLCPDELHRDYQNILSEPDTSRFDELPRLHRHQEVNIVSKLYRAMDERQAIETKYTSMTTGKDEAQWIAPVCFGSDGERLHIRAFSYKHDEYRDYLPVRINQASSFKTRPLDSELPPDHDWDTIVQIHLVPRSTLSKRQKDAVRREYGFSGPTLCIETRKALEFYAESRWGLNVPSARLEKRSSKKLLSPSKEANAE